MAYSITNASEYLCILIESVKVAHQIRHVLIRASNLFLVAEDLIFVGADVEPLLTDFLL